MDQIEDLWKLWTFEVFVLWVYFLIRDGASFIF